MLIPALVTRLDLELFDSDAWDTEMAVDAHRHSPRPDSKGVKVFVKKSTF